MPLVEGVCVTFDKMNTSIFRQFLCRILIQGKRFNVCFADCTKIK